MYLRILYRFIYLNFRKIIFILLLIKFGILYGFLLLCFYFVLFNFFLILMHKGRIIIFKIFKILFNKRNILRKRKYKKKKFSKLVKYDLSAGLKKHYKGKVDKINFGYVIRVLNLKNERNRWLSYKNHDKKNS